MQFRQNTTLPARSMMYTQRASTTEILAASSVTLAPGARVRRGEVIGRCGNSGNAGMPHLHIGFLSAIDPITTRPMRLSDYERAGPPAADDAWHPGNGFPVKDELLRPR